MIPEDIALLLCFGFMVLGMLLGAMLHAGLDERGNREEPDYMPTFWARRKYHQEIKQRPMAQLAAEGKEVNDWIQQMEKMLNAENRN